MWHSEICDESCSRNNSVLQPWPSAEHYFFFGLADRTQNFQSWFIFPNAINNTLKWEEGKGRGDVWGQKLLEEESWKTRLTVFTITMNSLAVVLLCSRRRCISSDGQCSLVPRLTSAFVQIWKQFEEKTDIP